MRMDLAYYEEVDAAYLTVVDEVGPGESVRQVHLPLSRDAPSDLVLALDEAGHLLGIEILGASRLLRPGLLAGAPRPGPPREP